jgi:hypothetical protein
MSSLLPTAFMQLHVGTPSGGSETANLCACECHTRAWCCVSCKPTILLPTSLSRWCLRG